MKNKAALISLLAWDVLPIVGTYYLLRALGVHPYLALSAGTAAGLARVVQVALTRRRFDGLAIFTCVVFGSGMTLSFFTGDERTMLAMKSVTTAIAGSIFLGSCLIGRPVAYAMAKRYAGEDDTTLRNWDVLFTREPGFRRIYIVLSLVWAVALLGESFVRIVLIYALPVDTMTGLSTALLVATVGGCAAWSAKYAARRAAPYTEPPSSTA